MDIRDRGTIYPSPVKIGKHVWIGSNVTILSGVTIHDFSIIGAGAVVTKNVPSLKVFMQVGRQNG
ncbi:DapH/DapD/GlmU-related protein [Commensalibacter melissae]|uniref:DapH/DapD/GlmU-related protein n=1 Tax=Commensalibacter TaxID=1079922 RepID=UPI0018DD8B2E|nr:DapH/DapD/GlmU-related protein [Commensalibacter melissae]